MEEDKYNKIPDEDYDRILKNIVAGMSSDKILDNMAINAILRDELKNDVFDSWEKEQSISSDLKERDILLFGEVIDWANTRGNYKDIKDVKLETATILLEKGYITKDAKGCEDGPEFEDLYEALKVAPDKLTIAGHVHPDRIDIDYIEGNNLTVKEMNQLVWLVHWANDYNIDIEGGSIYAGWD